MVRFLGFLLGSALARRAKPLAEVSNPSYAKNVGSSAEQCCDKTCASFVCPAQMQAGGLGLMLELKDVEGFQGPEMARLFHDVHVISIPRP